jgi:phage-related protein
MKKLYHGESLGTASGERNKPNLTNVSDMRQCRVLRPAILHIRAREAIREFPDAARLSVGHAIWELQRGMRLGMPLSRPMNAVAPGVEEIRIRDANGAYRVFYYLRNARGVLIFHAFVKKSQKTPQDEIETGRRRLRELLNEIG